MIDKENVLILWKDLLQCEKIHCIMKKIYEQLPAYVPCKNRPQLYVHKEKSVGQTAAYVPYKVNMSVRQYFPC